MLLFAEAACRAGVLKRFVHVSTAYVAGMREGIVREDELADAGFNSLYEQSKFAATDAGRYWTSLHDGPLKRALTRANLVDALYDGWAQADAGSGSDGLHRCGA